MQTFADATHPSTAGTAVADFADRRVGGGQSPGVERRQFAATRDSKLPEVNQLAEAIDNYKLRNRRRFITVEELHSVITELGYRRF